MVGLWLMLVLVDLVTVSTFARCFTGPGELLLLLPVCLLAHLLARLGRIVGRRTNRAAGVAIWLLAVALVVWVPIAALDWHSLSSGLPLGRSQHLLASQFRVAWAIFSNRVAPVVESPGLVMAAAWASGAVGLAAEALDADAALPAIVALIPAFDIVVFTGTLGTPTARAPELAALAAFGVAYLAGAARLAKGEQVVTARVEGSAAVSAANRLGTFPRSATTNGSGRLAAGRSPGGAGRDTGGAGRSRTTGWWPSRVGAIAAPGLVALAALAAGVVGPLLPGAKSPALVSWHGGPGGGPRGHGPASNQPNGAIVISNLVQMSEEEIDNPNIPLFDVYGPEATREVTATLDVFNGNSFLPGDHRSSLQGAGTAVPTFPSRLSVGQLERHPLPLDVTRQNTTITQVISMISKMSNELPIPGEVVGVDGLPDVTVSSGEGEVLAGSRFLTPGEAFVVRADINPGWGAVGRDLSPAATGAPAVDTSLPLPVPYRITDLANQWTEFASSPLEKALLIQDQLTSSEFHYSLPKQVPSTAAQGPYDDLLNFLLKSKTGYCQQFATAFAVMARAVGLPSRVVVGLLPGTRLRHGHGWLVTGTDVHAWPQVYFKGTGWVDFEPTPGSPAPVVATTGTTRPGSGVSTTVTKTTGSSRIVKPRARPGAIPGSRGGKPSGSLPQSGGGAGVLDVVLGLLAAAVLWAVGVPAWRLLRLRRAERDPVKGVLAEWGASVRVLAAAGFHRRRAETFDEYAHRVRLSGVLSTPADAALDRLVRAANHAVFGKTPPTMEQMKRVAGDASIVRQSVRKSLARWQQVLIQVDPRDLVHVG